MIISVIFYVGLNGLNGLNFRNFFDRMETPYRKVLKTEGRLDFRPKLDRVYPSSYGEISEEWVRFPIF